MRTLLCVALASLTACGGAAVTFMPMPLGEIVAATPVAKRTTAVRALLLPPNESLIWDVRAAGMTIGRAELDVGETDVHSKFSTSKLASMFATIHHELVTTVDREAARPATATETVVESGETTRSEMAFDGNGYSIDRDDRVVIPDGNAAHTIHSALGWLRAWADPKAEPSALYVLEDRHLFRFTLDRPVTELLREIETLRIDGHIRANEASEPIGITVWLTADAERKPLRIAITAGKLHIVAELVS